MGERQAGEARAEYDDRLSHVSFNVVWLLVLAKLAVSLIIRILLVIKSVQVPCCLPSAAEMGLATGLAPHLYDSRADHFGKSCDNLIGAKADLPRPSWRQGGSRSVRCLLFSTPGSSTPLLPYVRVQAWLPVARFRAGAGPKSRPRRRMSSHRSGEGPDGLKIWVRHPTCI